ncbi:GTPase-activator protein [Tritrichomonas foetus]|uniref:GTPase-activator protein n=1 Tax=Tritrichomonas foetus TaxID=1144522 RepID=A0A1J4K6H0_9EUKA|nr:GTPase-activator protein [Tritrichomonas foetus]|eukprot:OHT05316.1 GTPase-activator protein [Tritrichomonas foetus]
MKKLTLIKGQFQYVRFRHHFEYITEKAPMNNTQGDETKTTTEPFYLFNQYADGVEEMINKIDYSKLPKLNDKTLIEAKTDIMKELDQIDDKNDNGKLPETLSSFFKIINQFFTNDVLHHLLNHYPVAMSSGKNVQDISLFLILLIHDSKDPQKTLHLIMDKFALNNWHKGSSAQNSTIRSACVCMKRGKEFNPKKYTWIIVDKNKHLIKHKMENGLVSSTSKIPICKIKANGKTIRVFDKKDKNVGTYYPIDIEQIKFWKDPSTPYPIIFTSVPKPIPIEITESLFEALTSDDLLVLKTVAHFSVTKVGEGMGLSEALLNVFSYAGKVHPMLVALAGIEYSNPSLKTTTVLRSNSHLTNMFKIFFNRFGKSYYQAILKALIKYVESNGDIGLRDPETAKEERAKKVLFTVLKNIMRSSDKVPDQLRHIASILRSFTSIRFNDKIATFNSLSGFFCLRFITALMTDPTNFDTKFILEEDTQRMIMVPFSQLLQMPLNLTLLHNKMERFSEWNERISSHVFPQLMQFVYSLGDYKKKPEYPPPSPETLKSSLELVLQTISSNKTKFQDRYNQLLRDRNEKWPTVGWEFGQFLCEFFKNTIEDKIY